MRRWQLGTLGVVAGLLAGLSPVHAQGQASPAPAPAPSAPSDGVRLALSSDGHFGAMLVSAVSEHVKAADEEHLTPRLGTGTWKVASGSGAVDLAAALGVHSNDLFADAGGVLHVEQAGRYTLLVGADDGLSVFVDGKRLLARDEARPQRDDDDLIPLDLTAGDHPVVFGLHQRTGAWTLRARVLDSGLQPPKGASWVLPGAGPDVAASLAAGMSSLHLDRDVGGAGGDGYRLVLTVRFPEGVPRDVTLPVHARLTSTSATPRTLFDVSAGSLAAGERGIADVSIALPRVAGGEVEDDDWTLHVDVAGRGVDLPFHPRRIVREAIAHADRGLATAPDETVQYLRDRLASFVSKGDGDVDAQQDDARELDALASVLDEHRDPWTGRTGPMRRAYLSPLDGKLTEFAMYLPPGFDPARRYPLVVALHGMNGHPMQMLMWLFGHDEPTRDGNWEDRHPRRELEPLEAIVVAPDGHFNTMYRDLGERT
jgi:hypothetical protein